MLEESHGPKKLSDNHICREGILTGIFNSGEVEEKHFPLSFHMPTVVTQERRKYSAGERGTNEIKTPGKTKGDRVQSTVEGPARCTACSLTWRKRGALHWWAPPPHF